MLANMQIELPVRLGNFNESECSFETESVQKIILDKANDKIYVRDEHKEKTYAIEGLTDVVLINTQKFN